MSDYPFSRYSAGGPGGVEYVHLQAHADRESLFMLRVMYPLFLRRLERTVEWAELDYIWKVL